MIKRRNKIICLLLAGTVLLIGFLWLSLRPVEIVAVHQRNNFSDVLVKNFPFTDKGKIKWWLENQGMLKNRYGIPVPASNGYFDITVWLFDDGYKEEGKYDRLCFKNMKTEKNCIEKYKLFSVKKSPIYGVVFTANNGTYRLKKNGKVIKFEY